MDRVCNLCDEPKTKKSHLGYTNTHCDYCNKYGCYDCIDECIICEKFVCCKCNLTICPCCK